MTHRTFYPGHATGIGSLSLANCYFATIPRNSLPCYHSAVRHPAILFIHRYRGPLARALQRPFIVGESLLNDQLLNVNDFRQRCMKARPDTRNSLYYSNRLCFID
jgi:hypothetical protein